MSLYLVRCDVVLIAQKVNKIIHENNTITVVYNEGETFTITDLDIPNLNFINKYLDDNGFSFAMKKYVLGANLAFPTGVSADLKDFFAKK